MAVRRSRGLWLALLLMLALEVIVWYQLRGPEPRGADAPADLFSAARALAILDRILGDERPHPLATPANDAVRARLISELESLGLDVEIQESPIGSGGATLYNLLARLPETTSEGKPLVLATHYDSVPAGPGASDAGSCVAALIETARAMKEGGPWRRPVYFLFTDGEEAGMLGAEAFAATHPLSREEPIVLNFDARGTCGASLMYETHRGNLPVVRLLARHLPIPCVTGSSFVTVYRYLPNNTDFTIFRQHGWIGLNFAFIGGAHRYHTAEDTLENLSLRSLQHHGANALAIGRAIAGDDTLQLEGVSEDAVFFDVLGLAVVYYPQSWGVALALMAWLVFVFRSVWSLRGRSALRCLLVLLALFVVTVLASVAIAYALTWGLHVLGVLWKGHVAWGGLLYAVYFLLAALLVWKVGRVLLADLDRDVIWAMLWVSWSGAGVVLAVAVPGLSYFLVVPSLLCALLFLLPLGPAVRMPLSVVAASVILLPLANLAPVALGAGAGMVLSPVFVLVLFPLVPYCGAEVSTGGASRGEPAVC